MASEMNQTVDTLVLSDQTGNIYAIPRDVVERHRLTPEQKAKVEAEFGDDVSGFQMQSAYMMEKMAGFRQADRLNEANQARMAREAEGADTTQTGRGGENFSNIISGVWRALPFMRTAHSNP